MLILFLCLLPIILAHFLIIWFETEFFIEYIQFFRLNKRIKIFKLFTEQKKAGSPLNFKEFLISNHNSFFVHQITCPICLTTSLSGVITTLTGLFSKEWILSLMMWFPIAYISLFLYELMKKKMLK